MCGVLDADAPDDRPADPRLPGRRGGSPSWLAPAGDRVTGHEFHRTAVDAGRSGEPRPGRGAAVDPEGFVVRRVHASYLHLHWAGRPEFARRLVERAAACG